MKLTSAAIQLPMPEWTNYYWQIVKYLNDREWTHIDQHVNISSHTFIQCDIKRNKFSDLLEAIKALDIVKEYNPTVGYGLACVNLGNQEVTNNE